jgi:hypothetical protein
MRALPSNWPMCVTATASTHCHLLRIKDKYIRSCISQRCTFHLAPFNGYTTNTIKVLARFGRFFMCNKTTRSTKCIQHGTRPENTIYYKANPRSLPARKQRCPTSFRASQYPRPHLSPRKLSFNFTRFINQL